MCTRLHTCPHHVYTQTAEGTKAPAPKKASAPARYLPRGARRVHPEPIALDGGALLSPLLSPLSKADTVEMSEPLSTVAPPLKPVATGARTRPPLAAMAQLELVLTSEVYGRVYRHVRSQVYGHVCEDICIGM